MTARQPKPVTTLDEAIEAFIEGARLHHAGAYLQHRKMAENGILRSNEGVDFIDAHSPNARDILIPLLEHPEDIVQITAASALIPSRLELAERTIDRVHATSITEAFGSAARLKTIRNVAGDYMMGLCSFDPRYPGPSERLKIAGRSEY